MREMKICVTEPAAGNSAGAHPLDVVGVAQHLEPRAVCNGLRLLLLSPAEGAVHRDERRKEQEVDRQAVGHGEQPDIGDGLALLACGPPARSPTPRERPLRPVVLSAHLRERRCVQRHGALVEPQRRFAWAPLLWLGALGFKRDAGPSGTAPRRREGHQPELLQVDGQRQASGLVVHRGQVGQPR